MDWDLLSLELRKSSPTLLSWPPTKKLLCQVRSKPSDINPPNPAQFTICSSAMSDAALTSLNFFQLLHHSGNPWINLNLKLEKLDTGGAKPIFRLSVKQFSDWMCKGTPP